MALHNPAAQKPAASSPVPTAADAVKAIIERRFEPDPGFGGFWTPERIRVAGTITGRS